MTKTALEKKDRASAEAAPGKDGRGQLFEDWSRARKFLDIAGVMILGVDADQTVSLINAKGCEILEYTEEEIIGKNWFDTFLPERDREPTRAVFRELMEGRVETVETYENPVLARGGKEKIIAWHNTVLRDRKGRIAGTLSSGEDITERRQAAQLLVESEARFRKISKELDALLNAIQDPIILHGPDYRVLWANTAAALSVGKKVSELPGQFCYALWHGAARPCEVCPVTESFRTGAATSGRVTTPNGKLWALRTFPVKNEEGETASVISVARDVTENVRLEEQLRHAQKMEAVGLLAGGIAHDFNNILTAITGYGNLLLIKLGQNDPLINDVHQILASTERAAGLIQSLLAFSRKQRLAPRPIKINETIRNVESLLTRLLGEDVQLRVLLAPEDMRVLADSGQIEQVLMNLVTNARDAMPRGGTLTIATERQEMNREFVAAHGFGEPGQYARISVTDTGMGMDSKTREEIFEPFFTTKGADKGTGLGLSIAYGIISQHKGFLNVDSAPGKGSVFTIDLPLTAEADAQGRSRQKADFAAGGLETLLVAEDDIEVREIMTRVLRIFGYSVIEAADGQDALEKFEANVEDVAMVVLDVLMPKLDGKEVFERIKAIRPDMKVLFASGYAPDIIREKGILTEVFDFIQKPMSPRDLLKKVREILDRHE